jgi:CHASE2 domain-containing sensor protein/predicted Ser/Thr protein kinase
MIRTEFKSGLLLGMVVILTFAGLSFSRLRLFDRFEVMIYDSESRYISGIPDREPEIVLVDVDHKSLSHLGTWPWPRNVIANMCDILRESEARVIGIDLPLHQSVPNPGLNELKRFRGKVQTYQSGKRHTPLPDWMIQDLDQMERDLDGDRQLAESVRACRNVILGFSLSRQGVKRATKAPEATVLSRDALNSKGFTFSKESCISATALWLPDPPLSEAARGMGHLYSAKGRNLMGQRAHPLYIRYRDMLLPSYPLMVAMAYLNLQPTDVHVQKHKILLGERPVPLFESELLLPSKKRLHDFQHCSFADILEAKRPSETFRGKIVLMGFTEGINTPFDAIHDSPISRAEYTARVIDSLIHGRYLDRPQYIVYVELMVLLFFGAAATFLFNRLGELAKLGTLGGLSGMTLLIAALMMAYAGIWFQVVPILGCLLALYLALSAHQLVSLKKMRRDSHETNRLLALTFQNQGMIELAFEKFKACAPDPQTKELLLNLALEFEQRGMTNKAFQVYEYIQEKGGFKDVHERISRLQAADSFPAFDSQGARKASGTLSDSLIRARGKVGRYEVLEELGKGTMGLVYKGLDPKLNRPVALKIIRFSDEFGEDMIQEIKERFFREAEIAGRLSHPSIVTIYDVGEDEDLTYMAMEYLEGEDLSHYCDEANLLPFEKALEVVANVADALQSAHESSVIHRDIKPANIMLIKTGGVKVTDFGIAKAVSSSKTKTGVILGTPNYMSPEQIMGHRVDARTDIFSLGVLLFHLLTGHLPFHGKNLSNLLYHITQGRHPSVWKYNARLPKACDQIIAKALAKKPDDRFKTAKEVAKYLRILISKVKQLTGGEATG